MKNYLNAKHWCLPAVLLTLATLSACGDSEKEDPNSPLVRVVYDGVWEQVGYGLYVDIANDSVTRYEASAGSCIKTHTLPREDFPSNFNWTITEFNYDSFDVYSYENTNEDATLSKVAGLPSSCATPLQNSPTNVVNHLIAMADDYYAFFDERNIDWMSVKAEAQAFVHDGMSDQELKAIIVAVLSTFNDAHVLAYSNAIDPLQPDFDFEHLEVFDQPMNIIVRMYYEYFDLSPPMSADEYVIEQLETYSAILNSYMDAPLVSRGGDAGDKVRWATIDHNIGYLQIGDLGGFDPQNAGDSISEARNPEPHLDAFRNVLDEVVSDLQHTSGIILDLRHHTGGTTELDRALAKRFIENEIIYGSVSVPGTPPAPLTLSPYQGSRLSQPVVVISSGLNSSSAEDLIMALKADVDTTHIGERTHGILSDQLFLSLPNQWAFTLSNEIWLDSNGASWEVEGLPPADEFDVYSISDRQNGINSAIERALGLLQ